jgi:hypothetical protein
MGLIQKLRGHLEFGDDGLRLNPMMDSLKERMGGGRWEGVPEVEKNTVVLLSDLVGDSHS